MIHDKDKFYEQATKNLLNQIDNMGLEKQQRLQAKNTILLFRDSFKLRKIKQKMKNAYDYDSQGFCESASLAFVKIMGSDWQVFYISSAAWNMGPHIFIRHIPSRTILDLTFDQYSYRDIEIPYNLAQPVNITNRNKNLGGKFIDVIGLVTEMNKQNVI